MAEIELRQVSFAYPGSRLNTLDAVSLKVEHGQAHALLGASGAGKTTLLNLLSGLLTPTGGQVLFDGVDVSAVPGRQRKVAQVFQFPVLYESMTVFKNLQFPLVNAGLAKTQCQQRISHVAAELGIEALLQQTARHLNLFEKQLVAVAKALVRPDVSLVLLDEPLTAVEPKIKWQLRQVLRKAQADLGVTMIYVTHDQTEALTFADQVSILTEQGILQTGSPQQIYESPAHEFVGHFVGSPGMNFVPAAVLTEASAARAQRLGFRPEWAELQLAQDAHLPGNAVLRGEVIRVRPHGSLAGRIQGLTSVASQYGELHIHGPIACQVGDAVTVSIRRYVMFRDQHRISAGGL